MPLRRRLGGRDTRVRLGDGDRCVERRTVGRRGPHDKTVLLTSSGASSVVHFHDDLGDANIGGLGTLIGTPPNALLAGFLEESYGMTLGFGQWMMLGVPLSVLFLSSGWLLLAHVLFPSPDRALFGEDK